MFNKVIFCIFVVLNFDDLIQFFDVMIRLIDPRLNFLHDFNNLSKPTVLKHCIDNTWMMGTVIFSHL